MSDRTVSTASQARAESPVALTAPHSSNTAAPMGMIPANMSQAMDLANMMTRGKLMPTHLQNSPGDCLMVIEQAMRWNMSPFAVAQCTSSIKGKLMFEGKLVAAAVEASGAINGMLSYAFDREGVNRRVTVSGTRRGEASPRTVEVVLKDAITENGIWKKQPDQQLCYHGARVWARRWTPGVMLGVYSPEEMTVEAAPPFAGTTIESTPAPAPEPDPVPSATVHRRTWADLLADIHARAAACATVDEVVGLGLDADVAKINEHGGEKVQTECNSILTEAMTRVRGTDSKAPAAQQERQEPAGAAQAGRSAPKPQEAQERQQEPAQAATLYFPTDDVGEPALEDGAAFESDQAFFDWMIDTLGVTERPDALMENNRDALDDLRAVAPALFDDALKAYTSAVKALDAANLKALHARGTPPDSGDTAQHPDPAGEPQETGGEADTIPPVEVPLTPGKKPHWPNYADECGKAIRALTTQGDVTAWQNRNFPTYQGKAIEAKIEAHLREHRQKLSDAAAQPERDNHQADGFIADIKACATLNDLQVYAAGVAFKTVRARWKTERPDLWQRITAAGDARLAELTGA